MGQEMWIVDGELVTPWVTSPSGMSCRGIASPSPTVIEKGTHVDLVVLGKPCGDHEAHDCYYCD